MAIFKLQREARGCFDHDERSGQGAQASGADGHAYLLPDGASWTDDEISGARASAALHEPAELGAIRTLARDRSRARVEAGRVEAGLATGMAADPAPADLAAGLARAIETEIIPRLMLTYGVPRRAREAAVTLPMSDIAVAAVATTKTPAAPAQAAFDAIAIERLAGQMLRGDLAAAGAELRAHQARGYALDSLFLDALAPAARRLGALWEDDRCTFVDVTIALCNMQCLLRDLAPDVVQDMRADSASAVAVLLAAVPGEQHTFGVLMLEEFFRRAGAATTVITGTDAASIVAAVARSSFGMVGLSVGCESRLSATRDLIAAIRAASRNPAIMVMVGGAAFVGHPERLAMVGADATAIDARQAIGQVGLHVKTSHDSSTEAYASRLE
jgi:methanogenic corrinoid protein MtbC1